MERFWIKWIHFECQEWLWQGQTPPSIVCKQRTCRVLAPGHGELSMPYWKRISVYFVLELINWRVLISKRRFFSVSDRPVRSNWWAGTPGAHEHRVVSGPSPRRGGMIQLSMVVPHQWNNPAGSPLDKCSSNLCTKGKHICSDYTGSTIFQDMPIQPTWVFRKKTHQKRKKLENNPVFSL